MVSSTARDLPEHRNEVMAACLRQGFFPAMMEHLPASDADAIEASLRMVDEADIYLGIFAHRYGYVPAGHELSITEMEYDRAVRRGIPRLIFLTDESQPPGAGDAEQGPAAQKLQALKRRLAAERVVNFFKSPPDLRAHVIDALARQASGAPRPGQEYQIPPPSIFSGSFRSRFVATDKDMDAVLDLRRSFFG